MRRYRRAHTVGTRHQRRGWRERSLSSRRFVSPAVRREQQDQLDAILDDDTRKHYRRHGFAPRVQ